MSEAWATHEVTVSGWTAFRAGLAFAAGNLLVGGLVVGALVALGVATGELEVDA